MKAVERDPAGGWIARDPATGRELEEGWRWNTREAARDAVWQFQNLPPTRGAAARAAADASGVGDKHGD